MVSGNDYENEINQLKLLCYLQSDENLSRGSPKLIYFLLKTTSCNEL